MTQQNNKLWNSHNILLTSDLILSPQLKDEKASIVAENMTGFFTTTWVQKLKSSLFWIISIKFVQEYYGGVRPTYFHLLFQKLFGLRRGIGRL